VRRPCQWRTLSSHVGLSMAGGMTIRRRRKREEEERGGQEREITNFLIIFGFAEELQYSANLLSTVAPHHFVEWFIEPIGERF
jgi:hypothetical protein